METIDIKLNKTQIITIMDSLLDTIDKETYSIDRLKANLMCDTIVFKNSINNRQETINKCVYLFDEVLKPELDKLNEKMNFKNCNQENN